MTHSSANIISHRKHWWLTPQIIGLTIAMLAIGYPTFWWISTYNSILADVMFAVTYVSILIIAVRMVKETMTDPYMRVDERGVDLAKQDLAEHRSKVRAEFIQNEIDSLKRGERCPVLDIWRLDPKLAKRHPFFSIIERSYIDPERNEFYLRLQVGAIEGGNKERWARGLHSSFAQFLSIIAKDDLYAELKGFIETLIVEIYSMREDQEGRDVNYPVLSYSVSKRDLARFATALAAAIPATLRTNGELRFANGEEIQPHRHIEGSQSRGK